MSLLVILMIIVMVAVSAMLSATETAITAASPGKIYKLKSSSPNNAKAVIQVLKAREKVISTMLIGNSLLNTVVTTIATGLFIELLNDHSLGTVVSSIVMSFIIILFAEIIPKAIAITRAETIALFSVPIVVMLLRILKPVHAIFDFMVKGFCYIFSINLRSEISGTDEVRGIIAHHHHEGNVYKSDREMLEGVLDIKDMTISEIMVHRSDMVTINIGLPTHEVFKAALFSHNSRIPMWKDSKDNIVGILHIRELLKALYDTISMNNYSAINISSLLKEPWFVSDSALVGQQLHAFKERRHHLACVIDEYGDLQGMITLEDILEEIVGQIQDEHDLSKDNIIRKSNNEFIVDGSTTIRDLNRELDWDLPDDTANTVAGLIIYTTERIPDQGDSIDLFNLRFTVIKRTANKIVTIKIKTLITSENSTSSD